MSKEQIMKLVPLLVLLACAAQVAALDLVVDGRSDYVIVLAVDAIPAEKFAAEELVLHLELSGNLSWDHSDLYSSDTLSVIPEPATLTLLAVGTLLTCGRRRAQRP